MAEAVNLKVEMLEFFCKGIVGKQSVAKVDIQMMPRESCTT